MQSTRAAQGVRMPMPHAANRNGMASRSLSGHWTSRRDTTRNGNRESSSGPDEVGVTAVDDNTLQVELEYPVPFFLNLLTFSPWAPSIKGLLAGILILLAILLVLMVWTMVSHSLPSASSGSVEPEPASSEVLEPQNLVPSFIGMDYAQVQNNREYTGMYLFYVTEEYSDTVPAGQIMTQEPAADTVLKAGETIRLVVSKGPQKVEMPSIIGFSQNNMGEILKELPAVILRGSVLLPGVVSHFDISTQRSIHAVEAAMNGCTGTPRLPAVQLPHLLRSSFPRSRGSAALPSLTG